jgi:hypothetical protein
MADINKAPKPDPTFSEQVKNKTGKESPNFDYSYFSGVLTIEKFTYVLKYIMTLCNFYIVGGIKTFPIETSFIFGFILYFAIILGLFLKNPYDFITESNGGISIFLSLIGGFLIIISYFFYTTRKNFYENDSPKESTLSFFGKIISSFLFIGLIVLLSYLLFNFTSYYSDFSKYIFSFLNLFIVVGIIAILIKFFKGKQGDPSENEKEPTKFGLILSLLKKIILYLPCLLIDIIEYFKYQYAITTPSVVILFIIEVILIILYFLLPKIIEKLITHNSSVLLTDPINLNSQKNLGSFHDVNFIPNLATSEEQFSYTYAVSGWFYIDSFPPETNSKYDEYTSLLNIGNKPNILFNVLKNKLKITLNTQSKNEVTLYESKEFKMQKWNNIIINYDGSTLDIFINNDLVSSNPGVIPYNKDTVITSGTMKGIYGGICNIRYFRDSLSRGKISWLYNSVKTLNPPII